MTIITKISSFFEKARDGANGGDRPHGERPAADDATQERVRIADAKRRLDEAQAIHNAMPDETSRRRLAEAIDWFHAACGMERTASRPNARRIGKIRSLFKRAANQNRN